MRVEWLILADAAEVVGGKLYLLGGGWDVFTVGSGFPVRRHCAVAAAFRVAWNETNQRHHMEIEIQHEDGQSLVTIAGEFEVGRPPGIPLGQEQRSQFAVDLDLTFERPGGYVVVARIEGQEGGRVSFRVGTRR